MIFGLFWLFKCVDLVVLNIAFTRFFQSKDSSIHTATFENGCMHHKCSIDVHRERITIPMQVAKCVFQPMVMSAANWLR